MKGSVLSVFRLAPFTCIVLVSMVSMLVGGMMGWTVAGPLGSLWRVTIIPAYLALLLAGIMLRSAGMGGAWLLAPSLAIAVDAMFILIRRRAQNRRPEQA